MDYTTIIDTTTSSQSSAVFYGLMGAASGLILSTIGAACASFKPNIFHSQCSSSTNKQLPEGKCRHLLLFYKQLHQMITIHQRAYAQFVWRIGAGIHLRCIWHWCWYCWKEWTSCHF